MQVHKWAGEKLDGEYLSIDTETTNIQPGEIPDLVTLQASSDGENSYIVERDDVGDFLNLHRHSHWVGHNFCFDLAVLSKLLNTTFYNKIEREEIWDTGIAFILLSLAKYGAVPQRWSLDTVAAELLGVKVDKDESTRIGWQLDMNYENMGEARRYYAAYDAVITHKIWEVLKIIRTYDKALSHGIQLKGSLVLHDIMIRGMGFDLNRKESLIYTLKSEIENLLTVLSSEGYVPKQKGNTLVLQQKLHDIETKYELKLPRTETANTLNKKGKMTPDKISTAAEDLEQVYEYSVFMQNYVDYKKTEKLLNFFNEMNADRLYPKYKLLLETGRTSSYNHNHQNLPRKPGVRECFVPKSGYCLLAVDFTALEVCTFAQICYSKFGYSKFMELINDGKDVHKYCAAMIYGIDENDVTKNQRQLAKVLTFGFCGGMCAKTFVEYAKGGYNLIVTEDEAEILKEKWHKAFPETVEYLKDPLENKFNWENSPFGNPEMSRAIFKRIIRGATESKGGNSYNNNVVAWVYNCVLPAVSPYYADKAVFGEDCYKALLTEEVTLSGRICRNRGYCQGKNYHFQGLAADIAKNAGYKLLRAGYEVVAFIHDEYILEIPLNVNLKDVEEDVIKLMVEAANELSPDVKYSVEGTYMMRWSKGAKTIKNADGSLSPDPCEI